MPNPYDSLQKAYDEAAKGPLAKALPVDPPDTWKGREDRVTWFRTNFTKGEQALAFRLARDVDGLTDSAARATLTKEKDALKAKGKK